MSAAVVLSEVSIIVLPAIQRTAPVGFVPAGAVLPAFCAGIARAVRSGATAFPDFYLIDDRAVITAAALT